MRLYPGLLAFVLSVAVSLAADRVAPSAQPPAGLAVAAVPQFVMLGFDDNPDPAAMGWLVDYLAPRHNPAGSGRAAVFDGGPVRACFYSNGKYWNDAALVEVHRRAQAAGHEISN